jgi:lysyl-tRNA synthetase class 2
MELGNGYHELTDSTTHRHRFEENNAKRKAMGKETLPLDPLFLSDLTNFPLSENAYGIALGFDRLLMLSQETHSLHNILPLPWSKNDGIL